MNSNQSYTGDEQSHPASPCPTQRNFERGPSSLPKMEIPTGLLFTRRGATSTIILGILVVAFAAAGGVVGWRGKFFSHKHRDTAVETGIVKRGRFEIHLAERGNIDSANNLTLRSLVEGGTGTTILKLVDEGTMVQAGQIVVELDSARLRDERLQQQIRYDSAEALLKTADADCQIQVMQNESDQAAAELKLFLARLDLRKYNEADYKQEQETAAADVNLAGEYFQRAQDRWIFTKQLMRKGYASTKVLDADRVAAAKSKIDLDLASTREVVLSTYNHGRKLSELESNAEFRERELGRVKLRCEASLTQRQRVLLSRKRTFFLENQRLQKLDSQIAACTISAPRDGLVVHVNTLEGGRTAPTPLIYEGATVRERQPIINIPDLTQMRVNARVHESKVAMLHEGQEVAVHVDALQEEEFHGVVDQVAVVPNSASWPNINLKEYMTGVKLTDDTAKLAHLKPGMTAEVEILVDREDSVMQAPIQACVERGGRYFAWVVDDEEYVRHEIHVGRSNDTDAEILSGLQEGDELVLNPRRVLLDEIAELEDEVALAEQTTRWQRPTPASRPRSDEPIVPAKEDPVVKPTETEQKSPGAADQAPILIVATMPETTDEKSGKKVVSDPMEVFDRLDRNHDSQVSATELPDPMKPVLARLDRNGDHVIDKEEWKKGTCTVPPPAEPTVAK